MMTTTTPHLHTYINAMAQTRAAGEADDANSLGPRKTLHSTVLPVPRHLRDVSIYLDNDGAAEDDDDTNARSVGLCAVCFRIYLPPNLLVCAPGRWVYDAM
jgi:hypothetical protein